MDKEKANKFIDEYIEICKKYNARFTVYSTKYELDLIEDNNIAENDIRRRIIIN